LPDDKTIPPVENRVCDYEGSQYRTDFWEGQGRQYEDLVERQVMTRLLPRGGRRLMEVGAAYGRLVPLYASFDRVVLLDYSFSQLQDARRQYGDERFLYVAANAYHMPFKPGVFDAVTMVRVLHHFENVPGVLSAIRRTMSPGGTFLLEFANKRNLKAILRYMVGRQPWNPHDLTPVEFVELNFNFHPIYIAHELYRAGFETLKRVPVSFLRLGLLKRHVPDAWLAELDGVLQGTGWLVSPSVFTLNTTRAEGNTLNQVALDDADIFADPLTGGELRREGDTLVSAQGTRWAIRDGIYDFKSPI
jgi:ubiquinone/menaquinone biosynthesis C-methylase UbiE